MLTEFLKSLVELVSKAEKPVKVDVPDPRRVYLAAGGIIAPYDLPAPPRNHQPGTLDEVVALAIRFIEEESRPVVWYGQDKVVLVIDDNRHRVENATLTLERSDVFNVLISLRHSPQWFEPKPFIRLLRVDLAGTLEPGALIERVRRLKFDNGQVVTAKITRDDESMGREIRSRVSAEGEIPEAVDLFVPVYKTTGETERYALRCAVEVDPAMARLQILPLPDEIERVWALAVASIGERLREGLSDGVSMYQGKP